MINQQPEITTGNCAKPIQIVYTRKTKGQLLEKPHFQKTEYTVSDM